MKNNLIRGIRKASDFLMALQLTGAFKREALPNLQARLPAVVIGGGLTAIDTATELMAYYPAQVEKFLQQLHIVGTWIDPSIEQHFDPRFEPRRLRDFQRFARIAVAKMITQLHVQQRGRPRPKLLCFGQLLTSGFQAPGIE